MNLTEIRVRALQAPRDNLRAFVTLTLDGTFVVRDVRIIEGPQGLFVAMPSRRATGRCAACAGHNHLRARYCNDCGARLPSTPMEEAEGVSPEARLHTDIVHPISREGREQLEAAVLAAYAAELDGGAESERRSPRCDGANPGRGASAEG
ncbi:MAG: septation protein SpoVG family protein [Planctomycetes bacterium]|nr:septation protein SpoVG family protein [Planctomycetota bacterium]